MTKQYFKTIDQDNNIFDYNGLKIQIINNGCYALADSFKPNIYLYEFIDKEGEIVYMYVGKSYCGISGRFCDHITHNGQKIDKFIKDAKEYGYLIRITCLAICGSMAEMDIVEREKILEMERKEYNSIMNEDTDYNSYIFAKDILKDRILNEILF